MSMVDRSERLTALRDLLDSEGDIHPTDLVDRWDGWRPGSQHEQTETRDGVLVATDTIVGTDPMNTDRLVENRLVRVVNWLAEGEWEPRYSPVVLVEHPNGERYVLSDGNHRVLAHKYFGYDEIYADVTVYRRE